MSKTIVPAGCSCAGALATSVARRPTLAPRMARAATPPSPPAKQQIDDASTRP